MFLFGALCEEVQCAGHGCIAILGKWLERDRFSDSRDSFNEGLNLQLGFYYWSFSSDSTSPGLVSVPSGTFVSSSSPELILLFALLHLQQGT